MDLLFVSLWPWWYVLAVGIGIFAGFIGAIAGGRTLISISILLLFWLPVDISIATSKFWSLWYSTWSIIKYLKSWHILWKYVLPFSILWILWWYVWSNFLVWIDKDIVVPIIWWFLLLLFPFLFIHSEFGEKHISTSKVKQYIWYICYFFAAIYGGFFWGWVGMLILYTLIFLFGMTILEVKATSTIPWFLLNIVAVYVFMQAWLVYFILLWCIFWGMLLWWYTWAHVAIKKWNKWLKYILALFILFSAGKLLRPYIF